MSDMCGLFAAMFSLACVLIGPPNQIWKNYQYQSCRGLSFWFVLIGFFAYASWVGYGISKPDIFLCISQVPGSLLMLVILVQFWIYRNNKAKNIMDEP